MRVLRPLLAAVGLVVLGIAVTLVAAPDLAQSVPVGELLAVAGSDYVLLAGFGVVMVLATAAAVSARGIAGLDQTDPPDPEDVQSAPRPGEDFDESVRRVSPVDLPWTGTTRTAIRNRLTSAAIGVEMRTANVSHSTAKGAVKQGEWTDDRTAAAFLSTEDSGPSPGVTARLRPLLTGESWFQYAAKRTARVIADRHDGGSSASTQPSPAVSTEDQGDEEDGEITAPDEWNTPGDRSRRTGSTAAVPGGDSR